MNYIQRIKISNEKISLISEIEEVISPDYEIWVIYINSEIQLDFLFYTKEQAVNYFKRKNYMQKKKNKP